MISDKEAAERIYGVLSRKSRGEAVSTASAIKEIPIDESEILPVGSLLGIHNMVMEMISSGGEFSVAFDETAMPQLPHNRIYRKI